jgi:hypothetical protein
MAFHMKHLKLNGHSKVTVHLGYKTATISIQIPVKRLAVQSVCAAFGPNARIHGGRNS